jgi:predicted GIY-YIG superfamily endonuclease
VIIPIDDVRRFHADNFQPTLLYRLRDRGGALLYIGITTDLKRRLREHAKSKPWWPDVATVETEAHVGYGVAEQAEWLAIRQEEPRWNHIGRTRFAEASERNRRPVAGAT